MKLIPRNQYTGEVDGVGVFAGLFGVLALIMGTVATIALVTALVRDLF